MILKVYISNIAPGWSMQRQKELLAAQVPGWPNVPTYVDILPPAKRQAHSPASLIQRLELLRGTTREDNVEVIVVPSLACLAWEQGDFLDCVADVSARDATLVALDTGRRIPPNASPTEINEAAKEFMTKRRAAKVGGTPGYMVSAEKRAADHEAAAMMIKDRWELPTKDYPTNPLLAEAGICRNTANKYLKPRPEAQRRHRNNVTNRKRRIQIVTQDQAV